jgi:mannose-6-phosphate isomerase-like protein (cupin superfamily)
MDTSSTPNPFQTFAVAPQPLKHGKTSTRLVRTDHLNSGVQVVADGGETNLHAHSSQDEIWFVLSGSATFYTTDDQVVARLGKHQGLLIPHESPYWFESASEENLVILRFGAAVPEAGPDRRIDVHERRWAVGGEVGGAPRDVEYVDASSQPN